MIHCVRRDAYHRTEIFQDQAFLADLAQAIYPDWLSFEENRVYFTYWNDTLYSLVVKNSAFSPIAAIWAPFGEIRFISNDEVGCSIKEFAERILHRLPEFLMERVL